MSRVAAPDRPDRGAPLRPVERLLGTPGEPLGVGGVRVHTDAAAADSAQSMRARAYTYGPNIVFNRGEFDPWSGAGRRLLAHELAHVARQSSPPRYHLAFQKQPAAPPKFFAEVEDAVAFVRRSAKPNPDLPYLEALLDLSRAVEAQNAAEVKRLVPAVVGFTPPIVAPFNRSDEYVNELLTRTFLMGLEAEANRLRGFFRAIAASPMRREPTDTKFGQDSALWQQLAERTVAQASFATATAAAASIDQLLATFRVIANEARRIDFSAVLRERAMRPKDFSDVFTRPSDTLDSYFSTLIARLRDLAVPIFRGVESMMEGAISDLEADKGPSALNAAKATLDGKVQPAFNATIGDENLLDLTVEATRSAFGPREGRHFDYFDTSKAGLKRSVTINYFDKNQTTGLYEKRNPIGYIILTRKKQIAFLEQLYVSANRGAMGAAPLRLESVDDWRAFLHEKVLELQKAGTPNGDILLTIVKFLSGYLEAFTTSTPFNIEDVIKQDSENYNKRLFPRAITGQLIEDCGVYALRTAYMLSLVKFDLNLRIRFVFLPVHVGLVVTGDGLPTLIAHNNKLYPIDAATMAKERASWAAKDPTKPTTDEQFIGEVAGSYFTPGVDVPFRLEEAPVIAKNDPKEKEKLQKYYESTLKRDVLADAPKAGITQFHLEYLRLNDEARKMHNGVVVPTWNGPARKVWEQYRDKLFAELAKARAGQPHAYAAVAKAYLDNLAAAFKPVDDASAAIDKSRQGVSATLGAHPELTGASATRGYGSRVSFTFFWQDQLAAHRAAVADQSDVKDTAKPVGITPPFADPKGFLPPIY